MLNKLKDILDFIDYGYSEVYSATDSLPDYDANSSSRDYMSQAETYLDEAKTALEEVIEELEKNVVGWFNYRKIWWWNISA